MELSSNSFGSGGERSSFLRLGRPNHLEQRNHANAVNSSFNDTESSSIAFAANKAATFCTFGVTTTKPT